MDPTNGCMTETIQNSPRELTKSFMTSRITFAIVLSGMITSWYGNAFFVTGPLWGGNHRSPMVPQQKASNAWWRHQMETFSALLAICAGNSPVCGEFPAQRPVTRSFDVFFDLRLNIRLSKQSWGWWFETLPRQLWRHSNGRVWWYVHISLNKQPNKQSTCRLFPTPWRSSDITLINGNIGCNRNSRLKKEIFAPPALFN